MPVYVDETIDPALRDIVDTILSDEPINPEHPELRGIIDWILSSFSRPIVQGLETTGQELISSAINGVESTGEDILSSAFGAIDSIPGLGAQSTNIQQNDELLDVLDALVQQINLDLPNVTNQNGQIVSQDEIPIDGVEDTINKTDLYVVVLQ